MDSKINIFNTFGCYFQTDFSVNQSLCNIIYYVKLDIPCNKEAIQCTLHCTMHSSLSNVVFIKKSSSMHSSLTRNILTEILKIKNILEKIKEKKRNISSRKKSIWRKNWFFIFRIYISWIHCDVIFCHMFATSTAFEIYIFALSFHTS